MGEHGDYLDRMTTRLNTLEHEIGIWCERADDERRSRLLRVRLDVLKERLRTLRRAAGELTVEMTQSFTQEFERFRGEYARARLAGDDTTRAA